ncbi:MAG: hypothetical protein J3K34DRAFT_460139 [Monoraphidium minutum]|nr:MAG: hypothetical protein J3K34DRAFT_460139 [Monoraphidium minutum]
MPPSPVSPSPKPAPPPSPPPGARSPHSHSPEPPSPSAGWSSGGSPGKSNLGRGPGLIKTTSDVSLASSKSMRSSVQQQEVVVPGPGGAAMAREFGFHAVLGPGTSQDEVMALCGVQQLLDAALAGYHVTILAYGQTGSGKTHTMSGSEEAIADDAYAGDGEDGIVSRSVRYLFHQVNTRKDARYSLKASYVEIYNENVFDLVHFRQKSLPIKWDAAYGFYGLKVVPCGQSRTMMEVVRTGMKHRRVGSHQLNMESSRSHSIMTIYCDATPTAPCQADPNSYDYGTVRYGKLSFVDLAGSERVKDSRSEGVMLKETININKSLSVISTLAENGAAGTSAHVPYRDSKLTKLLMDSLGGSALTLMIACCSPSSLQVEETLSTLLYATRAKNIHNRPAVQYDPKEAQISLLRREMELLRQENGLLREQLRGGGGGAPPRAGSPGGGGAFGGLPLGGGGGATPPTGASPRAGAGGLDELAGADELVSELRAHSASTRAGAPPALRAPLGETAELRALRAGGAAPPSPSAAAAAAAAGGELLRRLKETQALLVKFSEENGRLARDNDRLRAGRNALSTEHATVLDEIDLLRSKLSQLEQSVLTAAGGDAGATGGPSTAATVGMKALLASLGLGVDAVAGSLPSVGARGPKAGLDAADGEGDGGGDDGASGGGGGGFGSPALASPSGRQAVEGAGSLFGGEPSFGGGAAPLSPVGPPRAAAPGAPPPPPPRSPLGPQGGGGAGAARRGAATPGARAPQIGSVGGGGSVRYGGGGAAADPGSDEIYVADEAKLAVLLGPSGGSLGGGGQPRPGALPAQQQRGAPGARADGGFAATAAGGSAAAAPHLSQRPLPVKPASPAVPPGRVGAGSMSPARLRTPNRRATGYVDSPDAYGIEIPASNQRTPRWTGAAARSPLGLPRERHSSCRRGSSARDARPRARSRSVGAAVLARPRARPPPLIRRPAGGRRHAALGAASAPARGGAAMGAGVSKDGRDILEAARRGDAGAVGIRIKEAGPRLAGASTLLQRRGVLHIAARQGQAEVIKAVIEPLLAAARAELAAARAAAGAEPPAAGAALDALRRVVNSKDAAGRTPLHLAAKRGHMECVRELARSCAANVFVADHSGCTCLHAAALRGHYDVLSYVLELMTATDANRRARLVNKRNLSGFSALSYAAWAGAEDAVRLLLRHGADAAAANEHVFDQFLPMALGSTPLHIAAARGHGGVATAILEHYALQRLAAAGGRRLPPDPRSAPNVHGLTPSAVAAQYGPAAQQARLARAIAPGVPIGRVVDVAALTGPRGPPALKDLAAAAWRAGLVCQLDTLDALAASAAGVPGIGVSGGAAAAAAPAPAGRWGCSGGSSGGGGDGAAARPRGAERGAHPEIETLGGTGGGGEAGGGGSDLESECGEEAEGAGGFWYSGSRGVEEAGGGEAAAAGHRHQRRRGGASAGAAALLPPAHSFGGDSCSSACWGAGGGAPASPKRAAAAGPPCGCGSCAGGAPPARQPSDASSGALEFVALEVVGGGAVDEDEEEDACGVCFEPFSAVAALRGCGHLLCTACARGVVSRQAAGPAAPTCPFCRRAILGFAGV